MDRSSLLVVLAAAPFLAFGAECTKPQEMAAETQAGILRSWPAIHRSFTRYGQCDDGAIGEGWSDSVTVLLADHWETLAELDRLAASDPRFRDFVLRHIDETVPRERLERIADHARSKCQDGHRALCEAIVERAHGHATFVTKDPLKAFVRGEYALGDDYFIRGNADTVVFRCILTEGRDRVDGVALSEISIWGRTGPWDVFRKGRNGDFEYVGTRGLPDTSCLESCRTREYLASGRCTWSRGWPRQR